jgi:Tfp pilus assembly protein PilN
MFAIVLTLNISLGLACLGLALLLLRLRATLRQFNAAILRAEKKTHYALHRAPHYILQGQKGTGHLRQQLVSLGSVQQQINRWAALLDLLRLLGMRRSVLKSGLLTSKTSGFQRT